MRVVFSLWFQVDIFGQNYIIDKEYNYPNIQNIIVWDDVLQSTREICNTYTNLTEIEIYKVEQLAKHLPEIASLNNAFVFIDCPAIEPDHFIVVAEAWPNSNNLLYQTSVLAQNVYKNLNQPF